MIPYILLMFVPLLFSVVAFSRSLPGYNGKKYFTIGATPNIINHSCLIPVFFMILFLLLALRDESIGRDLVNYKYYFNYFSSANLTQIMSQKSDTLYWLLNRVVGIFTESYQVFLAVVAAIVIMPIVKVYSEDREYGFMKVVLFMNMSTFVMMFSGLRQAIAVSLGLLAYEYVRKKKLGWFLLVAFIAMGFHHTGFIIFLMYPIYHFAFKKRDLWFIIPSVLFAFIFNGPIFTFASSVLSSLFGDKYDAEIQSTGAYTMLVVFVLFAILSYILPDEKRMDKEILGLRNFMLAAVFMQCFAPVHNLAMRLNYYFIIFIPILIPKLFKYTKSNMKDVELMAKIGITAFFVVYYLYTTYISCQTGVSALDTYPYVPFWKN